MRGTALLELGVDSLVFFDKPIRTTAEGMRHALIDLWLLGEADVIITTVSSCRTQPSLTSPSRGQSF